MGAKVRDKREKGFLARMSTEQVPNDESCTRSFRFTQSTKDDVEDDLLNMFGHLSVRPSKTWTMGQQARYKDAFKASEKESNFFAPKRDGGLENWVGFNPSRVGKDDRCAIMQLAYIFRVKGFVGKFSIMRQHKISQDQGGNHHVARPDQRGNASREQAGS